MVPLFEPSKKVVPLFEREKRWCHYLIITLKVVPLYDVYPINNDHLAKFDASTANDSMESSDASRGI